MPIQSTIRDGSGGNYTAKVTQRKQLVVAPLSFSTFTPVSVNIVNTAFNIVEAKTGQQFIITDIVLYANKAVGAGDATVEIYEASQLVDTDVFKAVFTQEMVKQTSLSLNGLNIIVTEGKWLNVKTDDNTIFVIVAGYFAPADSANARE